MVKDRLADLREKRPSIFQSIRESMRRKSSGKKGTLGEFLQNVNVIDKSLASLKDGVSQTKKLQANILSTPGTDKTLNAQLGAINEENRSLSEQIRQQINALREGHVHKQGVTTASETAAQNQLERMTAELSSAVHDWHAAQASYGDKLKERLRREYSIVGESKTDKELSDLMLRDEPRSVFTQDIIHEIEEAQSVLDQVQEREKEIKNLEKSVVQVHELFKDVQVLVAEQGETLNTIESRVTETTENVEAGSAELKKARKYKSKARRRKFVIAGVVILVLIVIGGIIAIVLTV